jgi:hypothetical protein
MNQENRIQYPVPCSAILMELQGDPSMTGLRLALSGSWRRRIAVALVSPVEVRHALAGLAGISMHLLAGPEPVAAE